VSQLIDHQNHTWKEELVRSIFLPHDADIVLSIRLPSYNETDFISWTLENHGFFTVKSAYNLALDLKLAEPPSSSVSTNRDRNI
jgi:hypothetical protein